MKRARKALWVIRTKSKKLWLRLSQGWKAFTKWITPVLCIGVCMVLISIIFIADKQALFQAAGTAILAAGLTIITTTLTGKEATRQQFAKEANTLRKDTIYGPLFIELKIINEWLNLAQTGDGPYPRYIFGAGGEPESTRYQRNTLYPTFLQWPQFRSDYRVGSFRPATCELLDRVQELIVAYNQAVERAMDTSVKALAPAIKKAITAWIKSDAFKDWDQRSSGGKEWQNDPLHQWNSRLKKQFDVPGADWATNLAKLWLGPYGGLGWFLTGNTNRTAWKIDEGYRSQDGSMPVRPDISWFLSIFEEAWSRVATITRHKDPDDRSELVSTYIDERTIREVQKISQKLGARVVEAKGLLESGIRYIRDNYEGGEPPV